MTRADAAAIEGLPRGLLPLLAVDLRQASLVEGLRAALACAAIVALNAWVQWPPLMQAALGALLTCLCDPGGPINRRLPTLLAFAVLGPLIIMAFGVLRNAPLGVVVPVACVGVFVCSYARVAGQSALQVGNLLTVVQVLALRQPITDAATALALGGAFLGGCLWAALLTLVIWRVHPFAAARIAVATVYDELAGFAADMRERIGPDAPPDVFALAYAREARRRRIREAIERARAALLASARARGPVAGRMAQAWVRLETAEQIFFALVGLADFLNTRPGDVACRAGAERMLRLARPVLRLVAHGIVADGIARVPRLDRAADAIAAVGAATPPLRGAAEALAERLRLAVSLGAPEGWTPGTPPSETLGQAWRRTAVLLRSNLDWQSEGLRHALRAAVAASVAFTVTLHWPTSYGHWLTIMLVLTMQPYVALTYARALERIGGTVAGGVVAAGLAVVCTTPVSVALACLPLAVLAFALRPTSFGLFMAGLTPLVILLTELGRPDMPEWQIAATRAVAVLLGSGLAVLAVLVLWPSWQAPRLAQQVTAALRAYGAFAAAEVGAHLGQTPPAPLAASRRAAGLAAINLEAALHRALLEPGGADGPLEAALTVDAALRRIGGRLSALEIAGRPAADAASWRAWGEWLQDAADRLAAGARDLPPRPALPEADPEGEALARMARQMELIAGALPRVVG